MRLVLLLFAVGCAGEGFTWEPPEVVRDAGCVLAEAKDLTLMHEDGSALVDGETLMVVHGIQGGSHVDLWVELAGLDVGRAVTSEWLIQGNQTWVQEGWQHFDCRADGGVKGRLVRLFTEPAMQEQELEIRLTLWDRDNLRVSDAAAVWLTD